jgi:hypothetical protein
MEITDTKHFGKQNAHACRCVPFQNAPQNFTLYKHISKYTKKNLGGFMDFVIVWL